MEPAQQPTLLPQLKLLKERWGYDGFKPSQEEALLHLLEGRDVLAILQVGYGKCHAAGDRVLLADGTPVEVEHVRKGDLLLGPDGKPRTVLRLARGTDPQMARITPVKGTPFTVTLDHVLVVKNTVTGIEEELTVSDYLLRSEYFKKNVKLFRPGAFSLPPLPHNKLVETIDGYSLGVLLGDGSFQNTVTVTKPDHEIAAWAKQFAVDWELIANPIAREGKTEGWRLSEPTLTGRGNKSKLRKWLTSFGLWKCHSKDKFIPPLFRCASYAYRLSLLAGLLDTDGHRVTNGGFEWSTASARLCDDFLFLARSLGFHASASKCGPEKAYHRVIIGGALSEIPTRIARKKSPARRQKKDPLRTGFTVEVIDTPTRYFGFELNGDHRYLMDDFIVAHNSIIFQVFALSRPGCCLVVSPLIALMKDQADDCNRHGVAAGYINSTMSDAEAEAMLTQFVAGKFKLFYMAPERLNSPKFVTALQKVTINLIAIDEIHCLSRQGHDFRPAYLQIGHLANSVSVGGERPPILGVTATATNEIETDIAHHSGMGSDYKRIIGDPVRDNLQYKVWAGGLHRNLKLLCAQFKVGQGRHIIYAGTRKTSEEVAQLLIAESELTAADVAFYHAGMDGTTRNRVQDEFKSGRLTVVVATCAFGMGIDIPDIRTVVHVGAPGSLEDYVQESGRAGRDGKASEVILLCDGARDNCFNMQRSFIERETPHYSVFLDVWKWLTNTLTSDTVLAMSGADIAERMFESGDCAAAAITGRDPRNREFATKHLGAQVLAVLGTLEAHGIVARQSMEAGIIARVDVATFMTVLPDCTGLGAAVGNYIKHELDAYFLSEHAWTEAAAGGRIVELRIEQEDAAAACDVSVPNFTRALKAFATAGAVVTSRSYSGKTTKMLRHGEPLESLLPRAEIEAKRARAFARLDVMLGYVDAKTKWTGVRTTDACYRSFIRDYFKMAPART